MTTPAGMAEAINTKYAKIRGERVRNGVIDELLTNATVRAEVRPLSRRDMERLVAEAIAIERVPGTLLVRIEATTPVPVLSVTLADVYARIAVDEVRESIHAAAQGHGRLVVPDIERDLLPLGV